MIGKKTKRLLRTLTLPAAVALGLWLSGAACNSGEGSDTEEAVRLVGAGATFPAPLYNQWFKDFNAKHPNVTVDYQGIGSGGGIKALTEGTVDFGASDAAMTDEEIAAVQGGVVMLPMTAGAIVLTYNMPGVSDLKLSREVYPKIFLGKITKWNDPQIAATNPGIPLPDAEIKVIYRADGSGTTFVFTSHLSAISDEWKSGPGANKSVNWPSGVGGKGNDGVTALVKQTPNSIGYVEYGYAQQNQLPTASLQNKGGMMIKASPESAAKALQAVELPQNLRAFLPEPAGADSYPIVTYTWLLCKPSYADAAKGKQLKALVEYCLTEGQKISNSLGYVPLPETVVSKVKAAADGIKAGG